MVERSVGLGFGLKTWTSLDRRLKIDAVGFEGCCFRVGLVFAYGS